MKLKTGIPILLLACFSILAAGCNSNPKGQAASSIPTVSAEAAVTASPSTFTEPPAPTPSATPEATKLYKLNKNYDVVPISTDNGAPSKVVLLTFDDGPKSMDTLGSLLDTLDKHKAKAIFFVNGYRVDKNPDLLKLIHERGQTIGNHSWDHIDLKKEPVEKVNQQIGDVQKKVAELIGEAPRFFRPPHGSGSDAVREKVKQEGMLYMTWSNGSLDWDTKTSDKPKEVIANVLKQLHAGSNILMHELPWTAEALDTLLTELESREYGFVNPESIDIEPQAQ